MALAHQEWVGNNGDGGGDGKEPMRDLPDGGKVVGNQLPVFNPTTDQRDEGSRDAHIQKDHERSLDGKNHDKLRVLSDRKQADAKQTIEKIARNRDSLGCQEFRDAMQFGKKKCLCRLYVTCEPNDSSSLTGAGHFERFLSRLILCFTRPNWRSISRSPDACHNSARNNLRLRSFTGKLVKSNSPIGSVPVAIPPE